jgi:uncharacterized membrane protein YfcA
VELLALLAAGLLGGVTNALAGGATLLTFPALMATGLSPVVANASNAVALLPSHLVAAVAARDSRPGADRRLRAEVAVAVFGGMAESILLLMLPARHFQIAVPLLIGAATILFAAAPRLRLRGNLTNPGAGGHHQPCPEPLLRRRQPPQSNPSHSMPQTSNDRQADNGHACVR